MGIINGNRRRRWRLKEKPSTTPPPHPFPRVSLAPCDVTSCSVNGLSVSRSLKPEPQSFNSVREVLVYLSALTPGRLRGSVTVSRVCARVRVCPQARRKLHKKKKKKKKWVGVCWVVSPALRRVCRWEHGAGWKFPADRGAPAAFTGTDGRARRPL